MCGVVAYKYRAVKWVYAKDVCYLWGKSLQRFCVQRHCTEKNIHTYAHKKREDRRVLSIFDCWYSFATCLFSLHFYLYAVVSLHSSSARKIVFLFALHSSNGRFFSFHFSYSFFLLFIRVEYSSLSLSRYCYSRKKIFNVDIEKLALMFLFCVHHTLTRTLTYTHAQADTRVAVLCCVYGVFVLAVCLLSNFSCAIWYMSVLYWS